MPVADLSRLRTLLSRLALPVDPPALGVDRYLELMAQDKKVDAGRLRLVLLEALGRATTRTDVPSADFEAALAR